MPVADLTPEQAAVLAVSDRPTLVQAGPGSGKTRTLVARFLALVAAGVAPERILVLTFSQRAAGEFRQRVELATRRSVSTLWISTFHSFGWDLLRRHPQASGLPRSFRLLTGFKEWVLVRDVLRDVPLSAAMQAAREARGLVGEVANALALLKQNMIGPEVVERAAAASADPFLEDLARVYRGYEQQLVARRHFDFRDLILRARELLRAHPAVLAATRARFDALLLDELQDMDPAQIELVRLLAAGSPIERRLTAAGDLDQSIYGFRGARPRQVLDALREGFPTLCERPLTLNHRARPALVALSRRVLPPALPAPAGAATAPAEADEPTARVEVLAAPDSLAEATGLVRALRRLHGQPRASGRGTLRWRDMAILCRSLKRDAKSIEGELERLKVPYRVYGNTGFYRNPAVAYLVNTLLALASEADDAPLRRVLASSVLALPTDALARFLDRVQRRGRHAGRYLWYLRFLMEAENPQRWPIWRPGGASDSGAAAADVERSELDAELSLEGQGAARTQREPPYFYALMSAEEKQAFYAFHQRWVLLRARARRGNESLPALVAAVARESGLVAWILELERRDPRAAARHAANLAKLQAMVEELTEIAAAGGQPRPGLGELADHLRELLEHFAHESEVEPPEDPGQPEDAVAVLTVHQAKGLEWDVVAIPHCVVGRFPAPPRPAVVLSDEVVRALARGGQVVHDPGALPAAEHWEEERRLFYVATTRARERVLLSWATRYDGEEEDSAPSPWLLAALGGSEAGLWRAVEDEGRSVSGAVGALAAASRAPRVAFRDREEETGRLEEAVGADELEVALRSLYQQASPATRAELDRVLAAAPSTPGGVDLTFVRSPDPFPREAPGALGLDPAALVLSASRLEEYRDCPRKFYYSKLLHLVPATRSEALFGTIVHEVLAAFHDAHPDLQAARDEAGRAALAAELRAAFEAALLAAHERFLSEFDYRRQVAAARAMVGPYLELLPQEPVPWVAGREAELEFPAGPARMLAKIDRILADAPALADARQVLISDYKTAQSVNPRGLTLKKRITDGHELQLVTYYQAYLSRYGVAPRWLGKVFLRRRSEWRPGALQVLLQVSATKPGGDFSGRRGRKWTDRAWIAPEELDEAWAAILTRVGEILDPGRAGFGITPAPSVCGWCAYGAICGKEDGDAADA